METTKRNLIVLMALALLIALAPVGQAQAGPRIRASVKTPHLSVRVNTQTSPATRYKHLRTRPVQRHDVVRLSKQDSKIARRLARYTGSSKRLLLNVRSEGYSWREIGRWLDLRPRVVRAAQHSKTWKQFLRGDRREVFCGTHSHR